MDIPWNRVGLTHISFNVRNLQKWYDYLISKGVECVSKPERSPRGHSFFFAKDFDGRHGENRQEDDDAEGGDEPRRTGDGQMMRVRRFEQPVDALDRGKIDLKRFDAAPHSA